MKLALCLILAFTCTSMAENCPKQCVCEMVHERLSMECEFGNAEAMKKVMKNLSHKELEIHKMYAESDQIFALGPRLLGNMTVDKFYFNGMNLAAISPLAFEGQEENIFKVGIDNAQMTSVPIASIAYLMRLEQFEFRFTRNIRVLEECAFCPLINPEAMQRIDLRGNNIEIILENAFASLIRLKWLRLWDNNIKHIPYNIFPKKGGHLTYIDMEANELVHVPHHLIAPLPYMAYISMNNNLIEHLPHQSIGHIIERNITVKLYHNQVECHCGFLKIAERNEQGIPWHGKEDDCVKPYRLAKKKIIDLRPSDFKNCKGESHYTVG